MKKLISVKQVILFFCALFLVQTLVHAFSFDFQSLFSNFNFRSAQSYFFGNSQKKESFILAENNNESTENESESESENEKNKKITTVTEAWKKIQENAKKELKPYYEMVNYKEFKEQYMRFFSPPNAGESAEIQKGQRLTAKGQIDPYLDDEGKFLSKRMNIVFDNIPKVLGYKLSDKKDIPRIGIALSGGGYRAMILAAGYLKALEDMNLLDSALYVATLSGSTWYLGPWIYQQPSPKYLSVNKFNQMLLAKVRNNNLSLFDKSKKDFDVKTFAREFATEVIWPKVLYDQVIASIDIYGAALSDLLLADLGEKRLIARLSAQDSKINLGITPFPIYTAVSEVSGTDHPYDWYEFNPYRIWNLEHDCSFESYAFGRKFDNGKALKQGTAYPPEQSFGFLMGIFGSAFTVNLNDIINIFFGIDIKTEKNYPKKMAQWFGKSVEWGTEGIKVLSKYFNLAKKGDFKGIWQDVSKNLKEALPQMQGTILISFLQIVSDVVIKKGLEKKIMIGGKEIKVGSTRFVPAQVNNPFKGYDGVNDSLKEQEISTFIDAGISYNIPLRPLFRPERDLDLIIIGDASGDVPAGPAELDKALQDIKRFYGLDYKKDEKMSSKTMMVYRPEQKSYPYVEEKKLEHVEPPLLAYFNYLKDEELLEEAQKDKTLNDIIVANNLNKFSETCLDSYCSTYNFNYNEEQFKELSGIGEFNMRAHEKALQELVKQARARAEDEAGFGA